jgi:hypothetical protein
VLWQVARYAAGEPPVVVATQWGDDEGEGDSPESGEASACR